MKKEQTLTKVTTLDEFFETEKRERHLHPIRYKLECLYYRIIGLRRIPTNIKRRVEAFIQRGKRGWGESDVWGLDYYLSSVIAQSVRRLGHIHNGHPNGLTEDKWILILHKIIDTFETAQKISEGELIYLPEEEYTEEQRNHWRKTCKEINKKHGGNDRIMTKEEIRAYKKGWELFQEHFFSLWD